MVDPSPYHVMQYGRLRNWDIVSGGSIIVFTPGATTRSENWEILATGFSSKGDSPISLANPHWHSLSRIHRISYWLWRKLR